MKVVDEKGRLFGVINVIDFMAVVFLLALLPMFYFGYKIFFRKSAPEVITGHNMQVEMICKLIKLDPQLAKAISVGDKEYNESREIIGEVIEAGEILTQNYEVDIGDGKKIVKEDSTLKQRVVKLRLSVIAKENEIYYKDKLLLINSPLIFKTDKYEVMMIPMSESKTEIFEERYIGIYVMLKDLDTDTTSLVKEGDCEKNDKGDIVFEILSIGKIQNNSFVFNLGDNNFVQAEDLKKKQVGVKARLKCQIKDNNQLYFKNKKISYNSSIEFNSGKYKVTGVISNLYEMFSIKEKDLIVQVKFTGLIPEIANVVKQGDTARNAVGEVNAKIRNVITNKPSELLTIRDNLIVELKEPFFRDMILELDVPGLEKDSTYYFNNNPIKIGNVIVFATDLYSISGTVLSFKVK